MEDDQAMVSPQFWVGRLRRDAQDALEYGCNGLIGIHWRTRVLGPNVSALAKAGWDQKGWHNKSGPIKNPPYQRRQVFDKSDIYPDKPRDLPCEDFYSDWVKTQFGHGAVKELLALFKSLDGGGDKYGGRWRWANIHRASHWLGGPGGINTNKHSWERLKKQYVFVEKMEALRSKIRGKGSRERFNYWLNQFRCARAMAKAGCEKGVVEMALKELKDTNKNSPKYDELLQRAMTARTHLPRLWEEMMTLCLQTVMTPGDLGTISNLEQHSRMGKNVLFLTKYDKELEELTGGPLPPELNL